MTGPVMTRFGAHFIRLIERRPEETMTFESVRPALIKEVKKSTEAEATRGASERIPRGNRA